MLRKLTFALVLGMLGSGCGVGGTDGTTPPQDGTEQAIACTAQLTLSGTFTASATLDPLGGCQPAGMWVVNATVADKGSCSDVPLKSSYDYTLTGIGRDTQLMYSTGAGEEFTGTVEATGNGGCGGSFEHLVPDGGKFDQLLLKPQLPTPTAGGTTLAITGTGQFDLWTKHP